MSQYVSHRARGFSIQLMEFMNTPSCIIKIDDVDLTGTISELYFPQEYEDKILINEIDLSQGFIEILAYSFYTYKKVQKWILYTDEAEFTASYLRTFFNVDYAWNFEKYLNQ